MTIFSYRVDNLIQGVSQQTPEKVRDSQCAEQFDCLNSPKDGCVARPGADLIAHFPGLTMQRAYFFELVRDVDEHYLASVDNGVVKVFNLDTGVECAVTEPEPVLTYLDDTSPVHEARNVLTHLTVEDTTFLANLRRPALFTTDEASGRDPEALLFFKAGAYSTTYAVSVIWEGTVYTYSYKTPDNSESGNAEYIATNQLAATFYRALTGAVATGGYSEGVGGIGPGDAGGSGGGNTSVVTVPNDGAMTPTDILLTDLGFSVEINGNLLRIWRDDGEDFGIDTSDGTGDTHLVCLKDTVRSFPELPKGGFPGMVFQVKGADGEQSDDYYVEYVNSAASDGYWSERVKPGVRTTLNRNVMPHALVNTDVDTFEVKPLNWSTRISGDGEVSSPDPGFVGRRIRAMAWWKNRLTIMTDAGLDFSKARNPYTFFPDTAQTVLDTDPVSVTISAADSVALLRKILQVDESFFVWAQKTQFRIHSGQDPFRQDTVQADPSTAYEFSRFANFGRVGTSAYFASEPDQWATIRNISFQNGRPVGAVDVTAHIPEYIPSEVRRISPSDTGQTVIVQTEGAKSHLYVYNYLVQGDEILQSAWNTWRFHDCEILWSAIHDMAVYMAVQREDGVSLLRLPLRSSERDPGGSYRTRLDMRIAEAQTSMDYDADTNRTTVTLPYEVATDDAYELVCRTTSGAYSRGRFLDVESVSGATVVVRGDVRAEKFYAGYIIDSRRVETRFFVRDQSGIVPTDRLTVKRYRVRHSQSLYYRVEVQAGTRLRKEELSAYSMGYAVEVLGVELPLDNGHVEVGVDALAEDTTITLINDSPMPSRWQSAEYQYEAIIRARPAGRRQDG